MKIISENREARFEYFIEDSFEAGIALDGGEVKSIKSGNVSLKDAYCSVNNAEVFIKGMHVAVYDRGGAFNVKDSRRDRRLLLHKSEIRTVSYTHLKIEIGLCKGKHTYDKKQTVKERDLDKAARRELKNIKL